MKIWWWWVFARFKGGKYGKSNHLHNSELEKNSVRMFQIYIWHRWLMARRMCYLVSHTDTNTHKHKHTHNAPQFLHRNTELRGPLPYLMSRWLKMVIPHSLRLNTKHTTDSILFFRGLLDCRIKYLLPEMDDFLWNADGLWIVYCIVKCELI